MSDIEAELERVDKMNHGAPNIVHYRTALRTALEQKAEVEAQLAIYRESLAEWDDDIGKLWAERDQLKLLTETIPNLTERAKRAEAERDRLREALTLIYAATANTMAVSDCEARQIARKESAKHIGPSFNPEQKR